MIHIDTRDAVRTFNNLASRLSDAQIKRAMSLAMNDTMSKERTQLRQFARKKYNFSSQDINTINFTRARANKLESKMNANYKPKTLASFKPTYQTQSFTIKTVRKKGKYESKATKGRKNAALGVSFEVRKGKKVSLPYAFMISGKIPVFARGVYTSGRNFEKSKSRFPVSAILTVSVYNGVFGEKEIPRVQKDVSDIYQDKVKSFMQRLIDGVIQDPNL